MTTYYAVLVDGRRMMKNVFGAPFLYSTAREPRKLFGKKDLVVPVEVKLRFDRKWRSGR